MNALGKSLAAGIWMLPPIPTEAEIRGEVSGQDARSQHFPLRCVMSQCEWFCFVSQVNSIDHIGGVSITIAYGMVMGTRSFHSGICI